MEDRHFNSRTTIKGADSKTCLAVHNRFCRISSGRIIHYPDFNSRTAIKGATAKPDSFDSKTCFAAHNRFHRISSGRIYHPAIHRWPTPKSYCFTPDLSWSQFVCARLSSYIVLSCRRLMLTVMVRQPCTAYLAADGPVIRIAAGCTSYVHGYFITSISYILFLKPTDKRF